MHIALVLLAALRFVQGGDSLQPHNEPTIRELLGEWKNHDTTTSLEVGGRLSRRLVSSDTLFFTVMATDRQEFESWVNALDRTTFTILNYEDDVDAQLETRKLEILRGWMLDHIRKFKNMPEFREMATFLESKLKAITIERGN